MYKIIPLSTGSDLLTVFVLWFFNYRLHKFNRQHPPSKFSLFLEKMIFLAALGLTLYGIGFWAFAKNPLAMGIVNVIGEIPLNLGMTFMIAAWMSIQFPQINSSKVIKLGIVVTCTQVILHVCFLQYPMILPPHGIRDFNAHPIPGTFMALYNAVALFPMAIIFGIRTIKGKIRTTRIRSALLSFASIIMSLAGILDGFTLDLSFRILSVTFYLIGSTSLFISLLYRREQTED